MTRTLYLVMDPENSDATFGPADEAELWIVNDDEQFMTHTGTAMDDGRVEVRVNLSLLIETAIAIFDGNEYSGKYAVLSADKVHALQEVLRAIGEDV